MSYHHGSIFKVLPSNAKLVDVEQTEDCRLITSPVTGQSDPTWTQITKETEIMAWLCHRNKCHHQQVWNDGSPPTQEPLNGIFGEHGITQSVLAILNGTFDINSLRLPVHVTAWLKWMRLTSTERKLKFTPPVITPSKFKSAFELQDEMTSSSLSAVRTTLHTLESNR